MMNKFALLNTEGADIIEELHGSGTTTYYLGFFKPNSDLCIIKQILIKYYSDSKPDNVMIALYANGNSFNPLCDWEQRASYTYQRNKSSI